MTKKIILPLLAFLVFLPLVMAQQEGGLVTCGNPGQAPCTFDDLDSMAQRVLNFALFYVAIPIGVVIIVWGGIEMMTSAGNPGKFGKGLEKIKNVFWGLLISFGAWIIIRTVLDLVFG